MLIFKLPARTGHDGLKSTVNRSRGPKNILTVVAACLLLAGCSYAMDAENTWAPDWIKAKHHEHPSEPEPDVAQLVRASPNALFVGTPTTLKVSKPRLTGSHWEACASAIVPNVGGQPTEATVVFPIEGGKIGTRDRAPPGHWCLSEPMEPL